MASRRSSRVPSGRRPRPDREGVADSHTPADYLDLYDFRTRVFHLYGERNRALREGEHPAVVLSDFRRRRDELFANHPQSALDAEQKAAFDGLPYFPYDRSACVEAIVDPSVDPERHCVQLGDEESLTLARVATVRFELQGSHCTLALYWIDVYGGGLFLPFRDSTAPAETYGGGRYLFDTVKGSDFAQAPAIDTDYRIELDFNYAYNPSCAYNHRWACPLAPQENHLPVPVRAGEKKFT